MPAMFIPKPFGYNLSVENLSIYKLIYKNRIIEEEFRKDISHHLIFRKDENDYIDLNLYFNKYGKNEDIINIFFEVRKDLAKLGWKTKLSFGDTGLFIYSTENPPSSCW